MTIRTERNLDGLPSGAGSRVREGSRNTRARTLKPSADLDGSRKPSKARKRLICRENATGDQKPWTVWTHFQKTALYSLAYATDLKNPPNRPTVQMGSLGEGG
jgi:hypothetical protein